MRRTPAATLLTRYWVAEVPASDAALEAPAAAQTRVTYRVPPGRQWVAQAAMLEAKRLRSELGIGATLNSVVWGGEDSGVLSLTVRYGSFAEMEQAGEQVAAYTASHGGAPLPQALAAGNLIPEGTSVSTLVAL